MGVHLDTDTIFQKNLKKEGLRKNGCLINSGSTMLTIFYYNLNLMKKIFFKETQTSEERQEKIQKNIKK